MSVRRLKSQLYNKRYDFDFQLVNNRSLTSHKPTSLAYELYISHLIRYHRVCVMYMDLAFSAERGYCQTNVFN